MSLVILIIIGVVIWLIIEKDNPKTKKTTHHRQTKEDKEFEEMNLVSKDDDFGMF